MNINNYKKLPCIRYQNFWETQAFHSQYFDKSQLDPFPEEIEMKILRHLT
jgi:hypothetical protein